jgi:hypothetical protein
VTVASEGTIEVENLPVAGDLLPGGFDQDTCTAPGDVPGIRNATTPLDVAVTNFPGGCEDTLPSALLIEPSDTTCVPSANPSVVLTAPIFDDVDFGSCSQAQFSITNSQPGSSLNISSIVLTGRFFFDDPPSQQAVVSPAPIAGGDTAFWDVYFCPNADNGQVYNGTLTVTSDAASSPDLANLTGTEAHPELAVGPPSLDFGTAAGSQDITISNNGSGDLTWSLSETDPDNVFSFSSTNGTIAAGDPAVTVSVTFTPAGAAATHIGSAAITASEGDAVGSPQTVTLAAETP